MELPSYVMRLFPTFHAGRAGSLKAGRLPKHTAGAVENKLQTRIQIYVKFQGALAPVRVDPAWTGSIAADRIQSQLTQPGNGILRFRGQVLSSHSTLKESGIELGSVLQMETVPEKADLIPDFAPIQSQAHSSSSSAGLPGIHSKTTVLKAHGTSRSSTRKQEKDIRIFVKMPGACGLVPVHVDLGWAASTASSSITSQLPASTASDNHNLRFRGQVLSPHRSLKESGIEIGSVIHIEPQNDSQMGINSNLKRRCVVSM